MFSKNIAFQKKFLDCVIGRSPSTMYDLYALLREAPSSPAAGIFAEFLARGLNTQERKESLR